MEQITIQLSVSVPMRDGVQLSTDIYRPNASTPGPALLTRTPYGKQNALRDAFASQWDVMRAVQAGFVVVVQDVRGRFDSQGTFRPHFQEGDDGVDTIHWIEQQPWSNGSVGMFGGSYMGCSQWMAARNRPAALKAIAPSVTPIDMLDGGLFQQGVKTLHDLRWAVEAIGPEEMRRQAKDGVSAPQPIFDLDLEQALQLLPLGDHPLLHRYAPFFGQSLAHATDPDYWEPVSPARWLDDVTVPVLHIGGWYDAFLWSTLQGYAGMQQRGGSDRARATQRLVIGPWSHANFTGIFPDRSFGPDSSAARFDLMGLQLRWFNRWLNDDADALARDAPVSLFMMGVDQWEHHGEWLPTDVLPQELYLHSAGNANSGRGHGCLSFQVPVSESEDRWLDDPLRPVSTVGGPVILPGYNVDGPVDQREVERRDDVLVFTTEVLTEPITICGMVDLVLYASTTGQDADFTGKLIDVFPDGRAINVAEGIVRARFRNGVAAPEQMQPDEVREYRLSLWATANSFRPGHRIRLEIASSNFPRFARNSHTGMPDVEVGRSDFQPAINRLWHCANVPSRLLLPIVEGTVSGAMSGLSGTIETSS